MRRSRMAELSRRERQIMDIVYREGNASVGSVREQLSDPPSYSAVRSLMRILEEKGHLQHSKQGTRYVYRPTVKRENARRSALAHVMNTFFDNRPERMVAALIDMSAAELTEEQFERLSRMVERARKEGK